jgi:hypothetical protein
MGFMAEGLQILETLTVPQLQDLAVAVGIQRGRKRKRGLLKAIMAAESDESRSTVCF